MCCKEIGGFDPAYFMYVEDADLTQKVLREGTVWLAPQFHGRPRLAPRPHAGCGQVQNAACQHGAVLQKMGLRERERLTAPLKGEPLMSTP